MKVLKEIKLIAQTKNGDQEVSVKMGINWGTAQPIFNFTLGEFYFDRNHGNVFKDHEKGVKVRIKNIELFNQEIDNLIGIIRNTPEVFDQDEFDNL